jgi:long-chain fatty acid transport protein
MRLDMSRFKDYEGLFAEQGDFDIPATLILGAAFKATPTLTIAFDVQEIFYSDIDALGNPHDLVFGPNTLGSDDGLGFGWEDQTIFKLGAQWEYRPDLTFRAGYSHADQVIPGAQALFNILAPATVRDHFTLGVGKQLANDSELNFAFMYAPKETVPGTNPNTGPQTGDIFMEQLELGVSWGKRF